MNSKNRPKVSLFIGEKNFVQQGKGNAKTGYKRHYENSFFECLKKHVDLDLFYLYPWKGKQYSTLRHLINHFVHVVKFRKEFAKKNRIKHIMFSEEAFMLNFLSRKRTIVSCLDVIPLVMPHEVSPKFRMFLKFAYRGMKKAKLILANSEYTKRDIINHLDVPEEKVVVAYPPVSEHFMDTGEIPESFYKQHNLDSSKKYLLIVGALDLPRKNIKTALKAFARIYEKNKDIHFILIGYTTLKGSQSEILDLIKTLHLSDAVHIKTDIEDDDLAAFYNLASVFLFPSLYEGFGLPPLEAMACGTPVVASHVASIPEVLGDAPLYIDPLDPQEMAEKIEILLSNEELCDAKIKLGKQQAAKYTWESYCEETFKAYKLIG